ncbi:MAG TPA: hypothetical protein VI056_05365 [Candidatus Limnocylindria bacterium]
MLDATHRVLADHGGAQPAEVASKLRARGYEATRQSARDWITNLQDRGLVDKNRRSLISPLYQAYLLVDLPDPERRPQLDERVRAHDEAVRRMALAGDREAPRFQQLPLFLLREESRVEELFGHPNLLIRTRVTFDGLRELDRTYRQLGARVERSALVVIEAA